MLKAGFARVDITPPLGLPMAGYFSERFAKGILDPLQLNALALSAEGQTAVIIAADLLTVKTPECNEIRALIAERVGIPADHVLLAILHQHTSVIVGDWDVTTPLTDRPYLDLLYRKFADVAQMAVDDLCEATLSTAVEPVAEQISFVRRYLMTDGTYKTNPGRRNKDKIVRPANEADNAMRLIRFRREGAEDIALVNFSTHPDVIGGESFSADWPGFVRRYVEGDLQDVSCLLINGAQGDTNHIDFLGTPAVKGYAHSAHMGRVIADAVLKAWDHTAGRDASRLFSDITTVYVKSNTEGEERYEECKALQTAYQEGSIELSMEQLAEVRRICNLRTAPIYHPVPVTVMTLGDVALVGFGGEPFTQYANRVREAVPDKFVIAACCANGYAGYLPTRLAFEQGGYEAKNSPFVPELEDLVVGAALKLLNRDETKNER
ncbi:MAG: hypothetical protein IJX39_02390 [Clostridia bacterium]|nr:hypothetical protein [Clostridia bacterium]